MSRQIGKIERKSRNGSIGSFFFGTFIGLLLGIGAVIGIVTFAYFKVSPNWINDKFNMEVDLGNDDLNNLTLNTFVSHAMNLAQNIDTYTLNDLKSDFGIDVGDEIAGINIDDLKEVPLPELVDAVQNKLSYISAEELKNVLDLSEIESILNETNTYYFNLADGKLYEDIDYNEEVKFEYTIDLAISKVIIKGQEFSLSSNQVEVAIRYIPLSDAIGSISSNMNSNITIGELRDEYNIKLPTFFAYIPDETPIGELEQAIDELTVAQLLSFTDQDSNGLYEDKDGNEVGKLMDTIADFRINELAESIKYLKLSDVFASEELELGALSLIDPDEMITNLPNALSLALEEATMDELINAELIEPSDRYYSATGGILDDGTGIKDKYINVGDIETPEYKQVKNLKLADFSSLLEILENNGILLDQIPTT